jgi:type I restriction enzyme S subunit
MSNDWRECKLGDVINLKRGYDLPQRDRVEGNIPIVTSSGITGYHNIAKAKAPGVVTGRYGTLGEIFYIKEDYWPHNTALYVQDFKGNDPLFVSYFLRTLSFSAQNVAGAVPGVNRNYLHLLPVRVPPLPVQRKIADVLSAYDDLIEVNTRRIRILEQIAQSVYREWFGKVDEKSLPEGWDVITVGDFGEVITGKTPSKTVKENWNSRDIPFIRTPDMHYQFYCIET